VTNLPRALEEAKESGFLDRGHPGGRGVRPLGGGPSRSCGVVVGGEGSGLRRVVRRACDLWGVDPVRRGHPHAECVRGRGDVLTSWREGAASDSTSGSPGSGFLNYPSVLLPSRRWRSSVGDCPNFKRCRFLSDILINRGDFHGDGNRILLSGLRSCRMTLCVPSNSRSIWMLRTHCESGSRRIAGRFEVRCAARVPVFVRGWVPVARTTQHTVSPIATDCIRMEMLQRREMATHDYNEALDPRHDDLMRNWRGISPKGTRNGSTRLKPTRDVVEA